MLQRRTDKKTGPPLTFPAEASSDEHEDKQKGGYTHRHTETVIKRVQIDI